MTAGRKPVHPGAILRLDVLPELGLTVSEAAKTLRVSRQTLHALLAGRAAVTPGMALRLGKLCGNGPQIWLNLQRAVDLHVATRRMAKILPTIPTLG